MTTESDGLSQISRIKGSLAFYQATRLASRGRYEEAEDLLTRILSHETEDLRLYDLLARICAQHGKLDDAERLWKVALQKNPSHQPYDAALQRVLSVRSQLLSREWKLKIIVGTMIAVVALLVGSVLISYLAEKRELVGGRAPSLRAALGDSVGQLSAIDVNIDGITEQKKGDEIVLLFTSGLFSRATFMTPSAKSLLITLGRTLERYVDSITVTVIGHTDTLACLPGSRYRDNTALGIQRAATVVEYLRATTALPNRVFSIESVGELNPLYPSISVMDQMRNRTVEIHISVTKQKEPRH